MDDLNAHLERLGREVAGTSDLAAAPGTLDAARRRWMAPATPRRRRTKPLVLGLAATVSVGILAVAAARWQRTAVSFELGTPPVRGQVGEWVAATGGTPLGVHFSEGTMLTLDPGARMRVTKTSPRGAEVLIERGTLHANVVHTGSDTRWAVHAGPFDVRVTGTSFDAGWDPASETFDLLMKEGSVSVGGPLLPPGRTLYGGEHLVISVRENRMELKSASAAPPASASAPADEGSAAPRPPVSAVISACPPLPAAPPASAQTIAAPVAAAPPSPTWQELAAAGKHRDALAAVEQRGFAQEIGRASAGELLALSDTARFAGRPDRAREALLALRKRFGAMGHSAFLLGKISADQLGNEGDAATWFETSLAEEPGGALAEQALGRILEIKKRRDPAASKAIAARYLQRYPGGAYAALARSLVDTGGDAPKPALQALSP